MFKLIGGFITVVIGLMILGASFDVMDALRGYPHFLRFGAGMSTALFGGLVFLAGMLAMITGLDTEDD